MRSLAGTSVATCWRTRNVLFLRRFNVIKGSNTSRFSSIAPIAVQEKRKTATKVLPINVYDGLDDFNRLGQIIKQEHNHPSLIASFEVESVEDVFEKVFDGFKNISKEEQESFIKQLFEATINTITPDIVNKPSQYLLRRFLEKTFEKETDSSLLDVFHSELLLNHTQLAPQKRTYHILEHYLFDVKNLQKETDFIEAFLTDFSTNQNEFFRGKAFSLYFKRLLELADSTQKLKLLTVISGDLTTTTGFIKSGTFETVLPVLYPVAEENETFKKELEKITHYLATNFFSGEKYYTLMPAKELIISMISSDVPNDPDKKKFLESLVAGNLDEDVALLCENEVGRFFLTNFLCSLPESQADIRKQVLNAVLSVTLETIRGSDEAALASMFKFLRSLAINISVEETIPGRTDIHSTLCKFIEDNFDEIPRIPLRRDLFLKLVTGSQKLESLIKSRFNEFVGTAISHETSSEEKDKDNQQDLILVKKILDVKNSTPIVSIELLQWLVEKVVNDFPKLTRNNYAGRRLESIVNNALKLKIFEHISSDEILDLIVSQENLDRKLAKQMMEPEGDWGNKFIFKLLTPKENYGLRYELEDYSAVHPRPEEAEFFKKALHVFLQMKEAADEVPIVHFKDQTKLSTIQYKRYISNFMKLCEVYPRSVNGDILDLFVRDDVNKGNKLVKHILREIHHQCIDEKKQEFEATYKGFGKKKVKCLIVG